MVRGVLPAIIKSSSPHSCIPIAAGVHASNRRQSPSHGSCENACSNANSAQDVRPHLGSGWLRAQGYSAGQAILSTLVWRERAREPRHSTPGRLHSHSRNDALPMYHKPQTDTRTSHSCRNSDTKTHLDARMTAALADAAVLIGDS